MASLLPVVNAMSSSFGCHQGVAGRGYGLINGGPIMKLREKAAKIATQFEGRCTCANMDADVDCPWCQVFYDMLQGYPLTPPPARPADATAPRLSPTAA
jgi:hypothetical protein